MLYLHHHNDYEELALIMLIFFSSYISTTIKPVTIKLGRVVSYYKGFSRIKSHNTLSNKVI